MTPGLIVAAVAGGIALALLTVNLVGRGASLPAFRAASKGEQDSTTPPPLVTPEQLAALPAPVARYIEMSHRDLAEIRRPHTFGARWRGRIRSAETSVWMKFRARQLNRVAMPTRHFWMWATMMGLPVDVMHAYTRRGATMRVRPFGAFDLIFASGPEMTKGETVTIFNDMALLAPATLADPAIAWTPIDDSKALGTYTAGDQRVSATLVFDPDGRLIDFISDDRLKASADGEAFEPMRWSTPLSDYRTVGPYRIATRGVGKWHPDSGAFVYIEVELLELRVGDNVFRPVAN